MTYPQQLLKTVLKEHGYSLTVGRQLVVDILWEQPPMTMRQILDKVDGHVDRASLYRTVDLFEQLGIVQKVSVGWKYALELTGPFSAHHHHLTCLGCGKTIPVMDAVIEKQLEIIAKKHKFQIKGHQIELQGICAQCATKTNK